MADARAELAVGVGAGAALAEVHVALGVERAVAHQLRDVLAARRHLLAAVDQDGAYSALQEPKRREEAGRAGTDDDGTAVRPGHRRQGRGIVARPTRMPSGSGSEPRACGRAGHRPRGDGGCAPSCGRRASGAPPAARRAWRGTHRAPRPPGCGRAPPAHRARGGVRECVVAHGRRLEGEARLCRSSGGSGCRRGQPGPRPPERPCRRDGSDGLLARQTNQGLRAAAGGAFSGCSQEDRGSHVDPAHRPIVAHHLERRVLGDTQALRDDLEEISLRAVDDGREAEDQGAGPQAQGSS